MNSTKKERAGVYMACSVRQKRKGWRRRRRTADAANLCPGQAPIDLSRVCPISASSPYFFLSCQCGVIVCKIGGQGSQMNEAEDGGGAALPAPVPIRPCRSAGHVPTPQRCYSPPSTPLLGKQCCLSHQSCATHMCLCVYRSQHILRTVHAFYIDVCMRYM